MSSCHFSVSPDDAQCCFISSFLSVRSVFKFLVFVTAEPAKIGVDFTSGWLCVEFPFKSVIGCQKMLFSIRSVLESWSLHLLNRKIVLLEGFGLHLQTRSLYPTARSCYLCRSAVHLLWFLPCVPPCKRIFKENWIPSRVRSDGRLDLSWHGSAE